MKPTIVFLATATYFTCSQAFSPGYSYLVKSGTHGFLLQHQHTKPKITRPEIKLRAHPLRLPSWGRLCKKQSDVTKSRSKNFVLSLVLKIRRAMSILALASTLWLGSSRLHSPPCYAASSISSVSTTRSALSKLNFMRTPTLDEMVNKYVKQHMFNDKVYDPIETAYCEAYDDATSEAYPNILSEISTETLGIKPVKPPQVKDHLTLRAAKFIAKTLGLSEFAMKLLQLLFTIALPVSFFGFCMSFSRIQKFVLYKDQVEKFGEVHRATHDDDDENDEEDYDDDDDEDKDSDAKGDDDDDVE